MHQISEIHSIHLTAKYVATFLPILLDALYRFVCQRAFSNRSQYVSDVKNNIYHSHIGCDGFALKNLSRKLILNAVWTIRLRIYIWGYWKHYNMHEHTLAHSKMDYIHVNSIELNYALVFSSVWHTNGYFLEILLLAIVWRRMLGGYRKRLEAICFVKIAL